jgi:hypothetical protein
MEGQPPHVSLLALSLCHQQLQEMSSQERFARAFFTLKSALGADSAWDFWKRLSTSKAATTLSKADPKATETLLKSTFSEAWTAAAPNAKTKKAKLAAKKTPAQVGCCCRL